MRLRLNLSGVDFQLKIKHWKLMKEEEDYQWCDVELYMSSSYIHYSVSCEMLMNWEVSSLRDSYEDLLNNQLADDTHIAFAEPDIEFTLIPAKRKYNDERHIYRNGYMDFGLYSIMKINFWCEGGLSSNSFLMELYERDCYALYRYLQLVTKQLSEDSQEILSLIKEGYILPE